MLCSLLKLGENWDASCMSDDKVKCAYIDQGGKSKKCIDVIRLISKYCQHINNTR